MERKRLTKHRDWLKVVLLSIAALSGTVFVILFASMLFSPSSPTENTTIMGALFAYTSAVNILVLNCVFRDIPKQIKSVHNDIVAILAAAGEPSYGKFSESLRVKLKEILKEEE